jgi:hypothetical protein
MAQNTSYNWPVMNKEAVCKTQNVTFAPAALLANLVLDGTMAVSGASQISFIRTGVSRSVSISSTDDLSGAKFTVTGIQNNAGIIKNNITGPTANGTVYTDEIFDVITLVTVERANTAASVTNVQVGTGKTGFLPLINADPTFARFNFRHTNGSYALSVIPSSGSVTYTVWTTLENIDDNGLPFLNQTNRFFPLAVALEDATTKQIYQATNLTNYILLQVTASATPLVDSLDLICMQS